MTENLLHFQEGESTQRQFHLDESASHPTSDATISVTISRRRTPTHPLLSKSEGVPTGRGRSPHRRLKGMRRRFVPLLIIGFMALSLAPQDLLVTDVSAQVTCCDAREMDYFLLGEADQADKGVLSPFSADLGDGNEVWVTTSVASLTEIARWRIPQATVGDYPASIWTLRVDYEVENAAGVQANVTAEVKIGGKSWSGSSITQPSYTPGSGTITVDVDVDEEGSIHSSGELIVVVLSVRTLIFNSPGDNAGVKFIWGSEEHPSTLDATLPIVGMDWQPAIVDGHSVQIPVVLISGTGAAIWEKSVGEFKIDGVVVDTVVATVHNQGAQIYLNWQSPESATDGVYEVNLSLSLSDTQSSPLVGGFSYALVFGEGSGSGLGIFPADEPLRSGGSSLDIEIDAAVESGDRIRRTTQLEMEGGMSTWIRWGLDNLGNESLDSLSQWRRVQGSSSTEATRNNHQVDTVEIQALETHLSGRASSLKLFLFDGLMLDPARLLGVEPIEAAAAPTVNIDMHGDYGFSSSKITITIESLENIKVGEKSTLFDNFVRPQTAANPIWSELTLQARLTTSLMVGMAAVEGEGVDYSHKRVVVSESITVPAVELSGEEMVDFRVSYVVGDITHAPLLTLFESLAVLGVFTLLASRMTRNKPRTGFWLTTLLYLIVWGYSYLFALPLFIMLAALGVVGFITLAVAIVTPKVTLHDPVSDEVAAQSILPFFSKRSRKSMMVIQCPICAEPIRLREVSGGRVLCPVCETRLKVS